MKKQLLGDSVHRRYDSRHRRLVFERFEERLTLSGSSVVPTDNALSQGGFISFDAGDYLSPSENVFLVADRIESLPKFDSGVTANVLVSSVDSVYWSLVNSSESFLDASYRGVDIDTLSVVYSGQEIRTTVPAVGVQLIDVQPEFRSVLDAHTFGATVADLDVVNTIRTPSDVLEDSVLVFNADDAISTASDIVSDIPINEAITDVPSQSNVTRVVGHTLRFNPGGTLAIQSSPQGAFVKLFPQGSAHSSTSDESSLQSSEAALSTTFLRGTTDSSIAKHVGSSVLIVDTSLQTVDAVKVLDAAKLPRESAAVVDAPSEIPQVSVDALPAPMMYVARSIQVESTIPKIENTFTSIVEGGPIEVTGAVDETQRAYEAEVFSTVAALLNDQDILARPTPPTRQPFSGELARSVAFETVDPEPTAVPAELEAVRAPGDAAAIKIESESETSRSLAFAQWPLVFSATLGAVFVSSRRRSEPTAT